MAGPTNSQDNLRKSTENYFKKSAKPDQSDTLWKQTRKKANAASKSNTARLRELRLAKEAADKVEADKLPPKEVKPKRAKPAKAAPRLILRY